VYNFFYTHHKLKKNNSESHITNLKIILL